MLFVRVHLFGRRRFINMDALAAAVFVLGLIVSVNTVGTHVAPITDDNDPTWAWFFILAGVSILLGNRAAERQGLGRILWGAVAITTFLSTLPITVLLSLERAHVIS